MSLLAVGLSIVLLAGVLARWLERRPGAADRVFRAGMIVGCLIGLWPVVDLLAAGTSQPRFERLGGLFGLDPLSAWFALIVLGVGATIAVYGTHYLALERPGRRPGSAHLLLAILIAALTGVVTAKSIVAFLASWEVMAVAAWLLVIFEHQHEEVRRAGLIYLVLTHTSTIALLGMFAAWGGASGTGSFSEMAAAASQQRVPVAAVLLLALIGFGIKAGAVPGHFWLPGAHAAAPSHISALLSGVMLKIGIYGLLRVLTLLGSAPAWWGWTVLLLGLSSALLGVLWALAQHDLKRLLAYHSVENIGIILMGIGIGVLGTAYHRPVLAALGFAGALLHALNHALFKSLLFLAAGAVIRVAGTRELDRLGGLARAIPRTAWAFLIGSIAIVGLPPLNGFLSEWLIFRGLFAAGGSTGALRTASATAAGLALCGALALACFTKVHGVIFLGSPREAVAWRQSAERGLVAPQVVLAVACVLIGVMPVVVIPSVVRVVAVMLNGTVAGSDIAGSIGTVTVISLTALGLIVLTGVAWFFRTAGVRRPERHADTWGGAFPAGTGRMQHTASSYAAGLLAHFGPLAGTSRVVGPMALSVHAADPVLDRIGRPLWGRLRSTAFKLRRMQTGRISWYLLYVISTLLGLLLYLWLARA